MKAKILNRLAFITWFFCLYGSTGGKDKIVKEEYSVKSFDKVTLSGTLTIPSKVTKIVITLHGSFVQNRDGDLDGTQAWMFPEGVPQRKLFLDISTTLAEAGIASFRFDKRASGKSEGEYSETDLVMLARDASEVLVALRTKFPGVPVGFVAQSEGALVALKEFQLGPQPDFLILQAPPLEPLTKILPFWRVRSAAPFLTDEAGILAKKLPYLSAFYHAMYEGDMMDRILNSNDTHYTLKGHNWEHVTNLEKYRQYNWDGYEMLKLVTCPVSIIVGEKDNNVPLDPIRRIVEEKKHGGFANVNVTILPGIEHSFREVVPGETFVQTMARPVAPVFLSALDDEFKKMRCASRLVGK
jgi:pimeloyl-ACP methyl ester carboxylesterase